MSQSEQAARPLLTPPIQDRPALWATDAEQTTVAAWATKTALMLDRSVVPDLRTVPDKDFKFLFEHRKPRPSLSILLGRYLPSEGETAFEVWSNTAWSTAHPTSTGEPSQGYSISFTVGHALFIVSAYEKEDVILLDRPITLSGQPVEDVLRRLWPLAGPFAWPPQAHTSTPVASDYSGEQATEPSG